MRRSRQLSNRILASVVGILVASTIVGFALTTLHDRSQLDHEYQQRALAIAQTFAVDPVGPGGDGSARPRPSRRLIRALADRGRRARPERPTSSCSTAAGSGTRIPNPKLIGQRSDRAPGRARRPQPPRDRSRQPRHLGQRQDPAAEAPDGAIIGEVSAGILERRVSDQLISELPTLLLYFACALGIGLVASITLARRLKRSTFGLELDEIAALVQEREAMLHGIREGVITLDPHRTGDARQR